MEPVRKKGSSFSTDPQSYDEGYYAHIQLHPGQHYFSSPSMDEWPRLNTSSPPPSFIPSQHMYTFTHFPHDVDYNDHVHHAPMLPTQHLNPSLDPVSPMISNPVPSHSHNHFDSSHYMYPHPTGAIDGTLPVTDHITSRSTSDDILKLSNLSSDSSSNSSSPNLIPNKTTSPPPIPDWYHEEKDNYLALQEKMGLV